MAHFYGTTGSNIATESGCSSSMVAIGLACKSLRRQDTSMALACGVNLLLQPLDEESMAVFCSGDGHCKTFDENANGFGRAEGCGVLILKRLSDAIRDGDPIRAVIRGYGEAQEGTSSSLGTPTVKVEACAMSLALKDAEVNPWEVSYVEAHGTGTAVGDPIEMEAIGEVYSNDRKGPLLVTSVKTNVGHTESVSGITGTIKTVLALQNQMIPPHRSLTKLNPKINLSRIPAAIPLEVVTWPREKGKSRIAGVSSFGIAGTDAHVILEEAPELINSRQLTKLPYNILALSARTEEALGKLIQSYYKMLKSTSLKWSDVCYTASVGRAHFKEFRVAVVAKDLQRLREQVEQFPLKIIPGALTQRPVVFLFTGQGSQYFGMAKQLYEVSLKFRETFNKCDNILRNNHSIDIKQATWDDAQNSMLHESLYSQTAIFVIDYCLAELWKSWGIIPEIVLGHSLGEYAAACIAGVISFENGLKLVAGRSTIISNIPRGKMTVTNLNSEKVGQLISEFGTNGKLDIAAINSPEQTTIAGTEDCITTFKRFCDERGVKTQILDASHAFHSYMMDPALEQLEELALSVKYEKPTCRFISGMEGKEVTTINADYWVRHTRQPVNFLKACTTLDQCGGFTALEMGPQPILSSFVATNLQNSCSNFLLLPSLRRGKDDWKKMMDSLAKIYTAGLNVKWSKIYENTEAIKINGLPTYPFQRKKFWFKKPKIESFNFVGNKLHPLTHCRISSPASLKIFESNLDLNKLTYMEDHVIGTQVIFPAAGYIEMILSAGYLSTLSEFEEFRHPRKPVHVSDLSIYAPLEMTKEKMLNIQTLVNSDEDSDKSKISIHKRMERKETSKPWSCHAEAKFTSSISDKDISNSDILDIAQLVSSLGPEDPNKFYESVHESGLKFGQTFRCIKQIWRGKMETVCQIVIPNSEENYFVHPIAIDAMIQVLLMSQQQYMSHLTLPTKIDNFSWFGICEPTDCLYIYTDRKTESASAILFDQNKRKVAEMRGVTFVPTTLANFKAALDDRNINLPAMLEEEWIPANTKTSLVPAEILSSLNFNNLIVFKDEGNETTFEHKTETQGTRLEEVAALMAMRALLDLGWKPEVGENIVATKFVEKFGIAEKFNLMTRRLFDIVSLHSIYLSGRDFNFNVTNVFPTLQEIGLKLKELELSQTDYETEIKCVRLVSTSSTQVLHGEESMLPVLFGDDSLAENVYTNFKSAIDCSKSLQTTLQSICQQIKAENVTGLHKLRILEIGGGTGSFTKNILPVLDKSGFEYSYIFTDISPSFLSCAKTLLYKWNDIMEFKVLDIEKCLESQGFQAEDFDIVIAVHVLHATRNLTETLVNVRHTLKPNGLLILAELCKANPIIDLIFGYVDGYWCFEDKEIRPLHCILPEERWPSVLNSSGFTDFKLLKGHESNGIILSQANATIINSSSQKLQDWILFTGSSQFEFTKDLKSKLLENSTRLGDTSSQVWKSEILNGTIKGVIILSDPSCPDSSELAKLFLEIIQTILSPGAASPKIIIVTVGGVRVGDHKIVSPNGGILWGMSRTLRSENSDLHITNIDLDPNATCESNAEVLLRLLWSSKEDFIAVRNNQLFKLRLKSVKIQDSSLQLPAIPNQFELILPKSNKINDLTFGTLQKNIVGGNEVVIQVKAAALNFRDLFSVLKPTEDFTKSAAVGSDMAGVITAIGSKVKRFKVGDAVTGYFYDSGGLPSHVTVSSDLVAKLPPNWTFEDGSTLPTAYATAYYSLVTVGKLQKGETVLIHTASGGVGLAAIQVAKNVGARIFATAGSQRKQTHLKEITNLKDISSSRQLAYKEDILSVTDGLGVDLVLNSLTGPGFKEATLDVCSTGGRFIEMSKLNIWSEEDVKKLRPDVQYTIVDLISISKDTSKNLLQKLEKQMENGSIHPLPYDLFRSVDIRTAFEHLQKAKHIGKVVCKMPKQHEDRRYFLFNDRSTYLITGGLGAIGLEAAKWMTNEGAKFIVLCGRNLPSKHATEVIESLNIDGKCVISYQLDISDKEGCTRLIEAINSGRLHFNNQSFPPLRGIQHAAGIISDATFANQTWEKYEETFRGKVYGALNLHELTKNAKYPLEHFVMHSSFAAIIGLIGQSNYAAANAYLDSLANYRNSLGLPATSINWGQWGNIGNCYNCSFQDSNLISLKSDVFFSFQRNVIQLGIQLLESI